MEHNGYFNPSGLSGAGAVNTPQWRKAEIPSTNGHASARAVARIYEALAAGGEAGGVRVVDRVVVSVLRDPPHRGLEEALPVPTPQPPIMQLQTPQLRTRQ